MADVFISYSRENQALVRRLAEAVKREGYSVWWDDELPPHLSYSDVITDKIGSAKAAIVVWSEGAASSEWVRAEADVARNQKKLIQTSIDERMPPMPFNQIQFASIGDWHGEDDHPGWRKVKASLEALCGAQAVAAPAHPMPATPPPAAPAPAPPHKWHRLLIAVILVSFLFIAGAGLFAWLRGSEPATPVQAPPPTARPVADKPGPRPPSAGRETQPKATASTAHRAAGPRHRTATAAPPAEPRAPANMRGARRYCLGPGRGTPECAELRARYGRRP